jgi:hypothetical protein
MEAKKEREIAYIELKRKQLLRYLLKNCGTVIKQLSRHGLLELSISCPAWLNRTLVIGFFRANGYVEYEKDL